MSKILVTGGAGFIGSHLVDALVADGHRVFVIDNLSSGKKENVHPQAEFFQYDIQDSGIQKIFSHIRPERVFHLAAQIDVRKSVEDPLWDAKVNIFGSLNILQSAVLSRCKKIVFASTGGAIYGETDRIPTDETHPACPLSPYGIAKLAVEHYLSFYSHIHKLPFTALRFSNIYGPRQNAEGEAGVVAIFCTKILSQETPVIFGDGRQTRDYLFVSDAVEALLSAMYSDKTGVYNVGTGKETDVLTLSRIIADELGYSGDFQHQPPRAGELQRSCLSSKSFTEGFQWRPAVDLREGIRKTASWFRQKHQKYL